MRVTGYDTRKYSFIHINVFVFTYHCKSNMNEHFYMHIMKEYFIKSNHKNQYLCRLIQIKSNKVEGNISFSKTRFQIGKKINVIIKTCIKLCTRKNDHDGKR